VRWDSDFLQSLVEKEKIMKRLLLFVVVFLVGSGSVLAQAAKEPARSASEQSLQELVTEVRQLRATLQRMNAAVYKGQVMLERFKLQQEQVGRVSRDLLATRESLSEIRPHLSRVREMLARSESEVDKGSRSDGDLIGIRSEIDSLTQREQRLVLRETQLANELELERSKLTELNDRLNALELEMVPKP
jgi:hypothetical protein